MEKSYVERAAAAYQANRKHSEGPRGTHCSAGAISSCFSVTYCALPAETIFCLNFSVVKPQTSPVKGGGGGRGAAAGRGRACPTAASKRPFSTVHAVPELSNSACMCLTGTLYGSHGLAGTQSHMSDHSSSLCMVSLHNLDKPGCRRAEPSLHPSSHSAVLSPCPHLSMLPTTDAGHPLVILC